jgi:carbon monoxide dehydrogenase subunit G
MTVLHLRHHVSQAPALVFDHLTDMQHFVKVHPIIYKIKTIGYNKYLIFERLDIFYMIFMVEYEAILRYNKTTNEVWIDAKIMGFLDIKAHFTLSASGHDTIVDEIVNVKSWLPVHFIIKRIFKAQHTALFQNICNLNVLRTEGDAS